MSELRAEPSSTALAPAAGDAPEAPAWEPFPDRLGVALCQLRRSEAFAALPRGPWLAFIAIACHWRAGAEAWPSQATIARFSGYSLRAVRDAVCELERLGMVRVRRRCIAHQLERVDYAPGPVTLAALAALGRHPAHAAPSADADVSATVAGSSALPAAIAAGSQTPAATIAASPRRLPAAIAGSSDHAAAVAGRANAEAAEIVRNRPSSARTAGGYRQGLPPNLNKKKKVLLLVGEGTGHDATAAEDEGAQAEREPERLNVTEEDRDVARLALTECFRRQHAGCTPLRVLDDADVDRVAICAAAIEGTAQVKLQALQDSLSGAARTSKGSPPTVRYIWGRIEHFLRHAERGRRIRLDSERSIQAPVERRDAASEASNPAHIGPSRAQMEADLMKLFGPTWRARL